MALFGFGKKKTDSDPDTAVAADTRTASDDGNGAEPPSDGGDVASGGAPNGDGPDRKLKSRDAFLRHARDKADKHQFEYALQMYADALRHDPGNTTIHQEMYDAALKFKATNGVIPKKKPKPKSSHATDKLIAAIHLASYDVSDPINMIQMAKFGGPAIKAENDNEVAEGVHFWGEKAVDLLLTRQDKNAVKLIESSIVWFEDCGCHDLALKCARRTIQLGGGGDKLRNRLKDIEAADYAQKNSGGVSEGGSFRDNIKDADEQRKLELQDASVKTDDMKDQLIQVAREAYEEDPMDGDRLQKLVKALLGKQERETEEEAIELLEAANVRTGSYKLKTQADDIRIRQFQRHIKDLEKQIKAGDGSVKPALKAMNEERNTFELGIYTERAQKYPTDMGLRYELGRRMYDEGQFDEAIAMFQQATADAKVRARANQYLGLCFAKEGLFSEAVQTFDRGIEAHRLDDDALGLGLRYLKMDALEKLARESSNLERAVEARDMASFILQKSINYRDIKDRTSKIKSLIEELKSAAD